MRNQRSRGLSRLSILLCLASGFLAHAQNIENQIVASQFGAYKVPGITNGSLQFSPASCQISAAGKNFAAFAVGAPVKIVDANPNLNEIGTPTAVFPKQCAISMATAYLHTVPFYLTSGTGGLQEAINNGLQSGGGPNTILLDANWYALIEPQSAAAVIAAVTGSATLGLVDITTTPYTAYTWNGSQYVVVLYPADGATFPGANGVVVATSPTASRVAAPADIAGLEAETLPPTIASAITAAGTTGSVAIPGSYTGTDTFSANTNGVHVDDRRPLSNSATPVRVVNAADFGATCKGVGHSVDGPAIQAAINAAFAYNQPIVTNENVTVHLPQGSCVLTAPLEMGRFGSMVGEGDSTFLVGNYGAWTNSGDYNMVEYLYNGAFPGGASSGQRSLSGMSIIGVGNSAIPNSRAIFVSDTANVYDPNGHAFSGISFDHLQISGFDTCVEAQDLVNSQFSFDNIDLCRLGLVLNGDAQNIQIVNTDVYNGSWNATSTHSVTDGILVTPNSKYGSGYSAPQGIELSHTFVLAFDNDVVQNQCIQCVYTESAFDEAGGGPEGAGAAFLLGALATSGGTWIENNYLGTLQPGGTIVSSATVATGINSGVWIENNTFLLDDLQTPTTAVGINFNGASALNNAHVNGNVFNDLYAGIVLAQPLTRSSLEGNSGSGILEELINLSGASSLAHTATVVGENTDSDAIPVVNAGSATGFLLGWNQSPSQTTNVDLGSTNAYITAAGALTVTSCTGCGGGGSGGNAGTGLNGANAPDTAAALATNSSGQLIGLSAAQVASLMAGQTINPYGIGTSYLYADQFAGSTIQARIYACNQALLASGGGTCDAQSLAGDTSVSPTIPATLVIGDNSGVTSTTIHNIFPSSAYWTVTMTGGGCAIDQWSGSTIESGAGAAGANTMVIQSQASTNVSAFYCTDKTGGFNAYIKAGGFALRNWISGATVPLMADVEDLVDLSDIHDIFISNWYGNGIYTANICCGANIHDLSSNSATTSAGGIPCVFGASSGSIMQAVYIHDIVCNSPGIGKHDVEFYNMWGSTVTSLYMEGNGSASPTPDTTTPMAYIASSAAFTWIGGSVNSLCASACTAKYGIENHSTGGMIIMGISGDLDSYLNDVPTGKTYANAGLYQNNKPFFAAGAAPIGAGITGTLASLASANAFSAAGAASTPGISITGAPYTGGSATTNFPQLYLNQGAAVTTLSTSGTEFGINAPSGFVGHLINLFVNGGSTRFRVDYAGDLFAAGTATISSTLTVPAILPGTLYSAAGTALPTCAAGIKGQGATVSDATSPTYLGAYTSGGGITVPVVCSYNGTTYSWLTH